MCMCVCLCVCACLFACLCVCMCACVSVHGCEVEWMGVWDGNGGIEYTCIVPAMLMQQHHCLSQRSMYHCMCNQTL